MGVFFFFRCMLLIISCLCVFFVGVFFICLEDVLIVCIHCTSYVDICNINLNNLIFTTMSQEIALFQKFGLSTNSNFKYSEIANSFIGNGYTSYAGNTYFNEVRFMDGILIKEDVGHGYAHTFLNGVKVFDIKSKVLLCEKTYDTTFYSESLIKREVKDMLSNLLLDTSRKQGISLNMQDVNNHIERLINDAFSTDQRKMMLNQSKLYLK